MGTMLDYEGWYDETYPSLPNTPFPGVAPVPTMRRQGDSNYDKGLDMRDGKVAAPNYTCMDYGANGKLGIDPGRPNSGGKASKSINDAYVPVVAPRKAKRK